MLNWLKKILYYGREDDLPENEGANYRPQKLPSLSGPAIWAVGSGKGGVGKSFISTNLGVLLARTGKKVLLVDADLGAANLHTFFGVDGGKPLSSYLKEENGDFSSLVTRTQVNGLDLVSGARDSLDVADINGNKIKRLHEALKKVDYDVVILDIGPGTTSNLLDLFLMSDEGIVLSTPEPTTIENNYRFLKCLFLRKIKVLADEQGDGRMKDLLQRIFNEKWTQKVKTVSDIIEQLSYLDSEQGSILKEHIFCTRVSILMNQVRQHDDPNMGHSIKRACSDYFGVNVKYLGFISYDDSVGDSIRSRKPLLVHYGQTGAARSLESCLTQMLNKPGEALMPEVNATF